MNDTSRADDASVIGRSRHDPEAFAEIFRRHAPDIKRYVTRRLGSQPAEDVVAETFLAAFRQRERYDLTRTSARPWLYGIATNLMGRHARQEVRQLRAFERSGVDPVTASFTDQVDRQVTAEAFGPQLARALAAMPQGRRGALLLVAWGDLSYAEVAQALDVRIGTVRSRINRARAQLRRELGEGAALSEELVHE